MPNANDLRNVLGLNDLGGAVKPKEPTGAGALRKDLEQAGAPSATSAGRQINWAPTSGSGGGSRAATKSSYVPSTSPLVGELPVEPLIPEYRPNYQTTTMPPAGTAASTGQPSTMASPAYEIAKNLVTNTPALNPVYEAAGIDPDRKSSSAQWEQEAAEREGRPVRAQNYWGEDYDTDGSEWGWFDNQLNNMGNTAANDTYVRWAIANGANPDDMYDIMHRDGSYWDMIRNRWLDPTKNQYDYDANKDAATEPLIALDDGTFDYSHLTADSMTGTQYKKYAQLGMGGRPMDEILPNATYSKRREANEYGFIPFTPDETSYANMVIRNAAHAPAGAGAHIARLRDYITPDYGITYGTGDDRRTISGRGYDKSSEAYMNNLSWNERFDPMSFLSRRPDSNDSNMLIKEYELPSADGGVTYHHGSIREDEYGPVVLLNYDENTYEPDGTYTIGFTDGTDAIVSQDFIDQITQPDGSIRLPNPKRVSISKAHGVIPEDIDSMNGDPNALISMAEEYGGSPLDYAEVIYMPDMELEDGTKMSYDDVNRIYYDKSADDDEGESDDDLSYNFSYSDLPVIGELSSVLSNVPVLSALVPNNKPTRLSNQELFGVGENGGITFNPADLGNMALDMTAGSMPISLNKPFSWMYSISNGLEGATGVDPGQYDPFTDSSRLLASHYDDRGNLRYGSSSETEDRDNMLKFYSFLGNSLTPLTEDLAGEATSGPIKKALVELGVPGVELGSYPTIGQVLMNKGTEMFGEGIEEDFGNIVDELSQYGIEGAWANQLLDEDGNPVYDVSGREVRDYDTPWYDRLKNAADWADWLNAFSGGAIVESYLDPMFLSRLLSAGRNDVNRRRMNIGQYVDPEEQERRRVSDAYAAGFSNELERSY